MMIYGDMLYGAIGLGLVGLMMYYNIMILENLRKHRKLSLVMFFLDDRGPRAFHILATTMFIFSIGMIYASLGVLYDRAFLDLLSKGGSLIVYGGVIYFLRQVTLVTEDHADGKITEDDIPTPD